MRCFHLGLALSQFLACFCGLGTVYTFGYWVPALLDEFGASNAQTQVVLSLFQSGFFLGGIPARAALKRWGFRAVYSAGGTLAAGVMFAISFAPRLWIAYSVFFAGVGMQAAWMVSGTLIQRHMPVREATQYGAFAVTGSGVGTMVWSSAARVLLPSVGWRTGFRFLGACFAALYLLGAVFQKEPEPLTADGGSAKRGYASLLRERKCQLMFAAMAVGGFGYMMVFAVQGTHARNHGVSMEDIATVYFMFGLFSMLGRILAGIIGARVNPLHVWTVAHYLITACVVIVAFSTSFASFAVGNALLGLSSGPMIALLVPASRVLVGLERIPEFLVIGMVLQAGSTMPAPALAGWLADRVGSYFSGIMVGAVGVLAGAFLMTYVIVCERACPGEGCPSSDATLPTTVKGLEDAAAVPEANKPPKEHLVDNSSLESDVSKNVMADGPPDEAGMSSV